MPPVFRNDPYPAYNFEVIVAGISDDGASVRGSFSEVSGLGAEITTIEYRTGSEPNRVRKLPGLNKFTNIILKRGIIGAFHHVSKQHLHRYVNEFSFRWDNRKIEDGERTAEAVRQTRGKRLMYKEPA